MKEKKIDGKLLANTVILSLKARLAKLKKSNITPVLKILLIGDNSSSRIYVNKKLKVAKELGISAEVIDVSEVEVEQILKLIDGLNSDIAVHGIIVQLPLPKELDYLEICSRVDPKKDVDGISPYNFGKLCLGHNLSKVYHVPCTAMGCIYALEQTGVELKGKKCLIINRSNIVGKPLASLLLRHDACVQIAHSGVRNIPDLVADADVLICAVGKKDFIKGGMLKPGAVVLDVGISKGSDGLVYGDCEYESCVEVASKITPVPGGIGPLTIAFLMNNVVHAAEISAKDEGYLA